MGGIETSLVVGGHLGRRRGVTFLSPVIGRSGDRGTIRLCGRVTGKGEVKRTGNRGGRGQITRTLQRQGTERRRGEN